MPVDVKNLPAYGSVKRCGGCAGIRYPHSITPTYREGAANKAWMAITCKACGFTWNEKTFDATTGES
jgi:hypothetical protein